MTTFINANKKIKFMAKTSNAYLHCSVEKEEPNNAKVNIEITRALNLVDTP